MGLKLGKGFYRMRLKLALRFDSPWAIATGEAGGTKRVLRDGEAAAVPGSALKGLWRDAVDALARSLGHAGAPSPLDVDSFAEAPETVVGRIFGDARSGERLSVSNAESRPGRVQTRGRVSIERKLGTARPGHLFSQEICESENSWRSFEAKACAQDWTYYEGLTEAPYEAALLVASLPLVGPIGSQRSCGLGRMQWRLIEARWASPGGEWQSLEMKQALSLLEELEAESYEMIRAEIDE